MKTYGCKAPHGACGRHQLDGLHRRNGVVLLRRFLRHRSRRRGDKARHALRMPHRIGRREARAQNVLSTSHAAKAQPHVGETEQRAVVCSGHNIGGVGNSHLYRTLCGGAYHRQPQLTPSGSASVSSLVIERLSYGP